VVPLIVLAEACSWYAVLTTDQRAHAVENSLWGLSAALAVAGMLVIGPHRPATLYAPLIICGAAYLAFIVIYDVQMYWSRWLVDRANGRKYGVDNLSHTIASRTSQLLDFMTSPGGSNRRYRHPQNINRHAQAQVPAGPCELEFR